MRNILCIPFISVIEKNSNKKHDNTTSASSQIKTEVQPTNTKNISKDKVDFSSLIFLSGLEENALWYENTNK